MTEKKYYKGWLLGQNEKFLLLYSNFTCAQAYDFVEGKRKQDSLMEFVAARISKELFHKAGGLEKKVRIIKLGEI